VEASVPWRGYSGIVERSLAGAVAVSAWASGSSPAPGGSLATAALIEGRLAVVSEGHSLSRLQWPRGLEGRLRWRVTRYCCVWLRVVSWVGLELVLSRLLELLFDGCCVVGTSCRRCAAAGHSLVLLQFPRGLAGRLRWRVTRYCCTDRGSYRCGFRGSLAGAAAVATWARGSSPLEGHSLLLHCWRVVSLWLPLTGTRVPWHKVVAVAVR
jgi:hypothetical protein